MSTPFLAASEIAGLTSFEGWGSERARRRAPPASNAAVTLKLGQPDQALPHAEKARIASRRMLPDE